MRGAPTVQVADDVVVEVHVSGGSDPLLLIQTALSADELVPLGREMARTGAFRVIDCRRRGYGASSPTDGPGSVARDATDCLAVLSALAARPAHVLGTSYSAAVALELAAIAPGAVRTLTLIEPPPRHGPPAPEFTAANEHLSGVFAADGVTAALEEFTRALGAPSWLAERATASPEHIARVERDATTFFASDVPALLDWHFVSDRARTITCPVLSVGGAESHPWFTHVRAWVRDLFPWCEDHLVAGAGHSVAASHSSEVADLLTEFVARHG